MPKVNIKATVWKEGDYYVSQCLNVDVASFGATKKEALANLLEALELRLEGASNLKLTKIERPDIVSLKLQYA
ncbi:MAG: type II toxin-antitoxin system HicB family antitoxin [Candidatus Falkowbacteria bacterium]